MKPYLLEHWYVSCTRHKSSCCVKADMDSSHKELGRVLNPFPHLSLHFPVKSLLYW